MTPEPATSIDLCETATERISDVVLKRPVTLGWLGGLALAFACLMVLNMCIGWLLFKGVGIWGVDIPVAWGFAIVNFVWWIGIGHAGTFISAILLLLHQHWRTAINRFSEAMTLFAVACAGLYPLMHLGRPWVFYWLLPYPDTMRLWPQWRSPLVWDVFAVSTYLTVSLIYWYTGLVPDLANMRDRAKRKGVKVIHGILALGWRGSAKHWARYEMIYLLLAGLATPLVLSVHSVVSLDFAVAILPGWHSTIFPPYFVAGAIFSGFAMVLTLIIPVRAAYGLKDFVTARHLDNAAKVMLATGLMVALGYISEHFMAWYSDDKYEEFMTINRMSGPYWPVYATVITCNILVPQALWFCTVRYNPRALWIISILINIGMWGERYMIVVVSLHRDFMPSSWGTFHGTHWDWLTFLGSFGLFFTLLFIFMRVLPMIAMAETRKDRVEEGGASMKAPSLHGLVAEFESATQVLAAARGAYAAGYRDMDAYTPYGVEELAEALGMKTNRVPLVTLICALTGSVTGYLLQYYSAVWDYPINVGGRPLHSWPSFIPITFELTVLFGAMGGAIGMFVLNGLPRPNHPIFDTPHFEERNASRFYLCIEASDAQFDPAKTRVDLLALHPAEIWEVPAS